MAAQTQDISSVLVVGAGTAGLISALMIRRFNPDLDIQVIYSPRIGHIMVGEGTVGTTPIMFHDRMGLDRTAFYETVQPTPKLGVRFLWGPRPVFHYTFELALSGQAGAGCQLPLGYACPSQDAMTGFSFGSALMSANRVHTADDGRSPALPRPGTAYHFENQLFVDFLAETCRQQGIVLTPAELKDVETGERGVTRVKCDEGRTFEADLYVDASGFSGALIHRGLGEPYVSMRDHLFCDRAVVGGWARGEDEPLRPYTTAETMDAGWCWQIEHRSIVNRGYVYCGDFLDDDAAEAEYRAKNPKAGDTRIVRFESRHIRRAWVGNVVAIGNTNGFVEPLEATNIQVISSFAIRLAAALSATRRVTPAQTEAFNSYVETTWRSVRDFLALHYKYNTRLDTPFWRHAREATPLGDVAPMVEHYHAVGPDPYGMDALLPKGDIFGVEGYLAILVGCEAPYRRLRSVSAEESGRVAFLRDVLRQAADKGADPASAPIAAWAG